MAMHDASFYKNEECADVQLVLLYRAEEFSQLVSSVDCPDEAQSRVTDVIEPGEVKAAIAEAAAPQIIASFPAHRLILYRREYFRAQIRRWQHECHVTECSSRRRDRSSRDDIPELHLTLDAPDQLAAAEAVIAHIYTAKQPMLELSIEQLVQAAVLSDRLQLSEEARAAVAVLQKRLGCTVDFSPRWSSDSSEELPSGPELTVAQELLVALNALSALPSCLLPVVPIVATMLARDTDTDGKLKLAVPLQHMALTVFGRLNEVWADTQLHDLLLELPLSVVLLLLSSDQLLVDSEDTVLYTASEYVRQCSVGCHSRYLRWSDYSAEQQESQERAADRQALQEVIRCPWLSACCLESAVIVGYGDEGDEYPLLCEYKSILGELLSLRSITQRNLVSNVHENITRPPASWLLPARAYQRNPTVSVTSRVSVDELQWACKHCSSSKEKQVLASPYTPPKAGLAWMMSIECEPRLLETESAEAAGGCEIGLYVAPVRASRRVFFKFSFTVKVWSVGAEHRYLVGKFNTSSVVRGGAAWGWQDYFSVGVMAGGFAMPAWIDAGWPESGDLEFELVMHRVVGEETPGRCDAESASLGSYRLERLISWMFWLSRLCD